MTLQDADHNTSQGAFPVTPTDLSEMPTNPLMPSLLPANLVPITPTGTSGVSGIFTSSEIIVPDNYSPANPLADQIQPDVLATAPTAFANSEIVVINNSSPLHPLAGPPSFAPMPPPFPPIQPARRNRLDGKAILAICAAFLLLIVSVGGLAFNFIYYQPYRTHASATATAVVIPTMTARIEQTHIASYESTQIAQQQATSTAEQNIYAQATRGKPSLNDSLKSQSSNGWDEGVIWQNASCTFKDGSYVVYQPNSGYFLPCFAENPAFINFAMQVDINILQGDEGGVMFRGDSYSDAGYVFDIDNYGDYYFYKYTNTSATLLNGRSNDYQTDQKNHLTVIAIGSTFYFYLNQHFLDSTTDKTFGGGGVGLLASDSQNATTVAYNNLKIWLLS